LVFQELFKGNELQAHAFKRVHVINLIIEIKIKTDINLAKTSLKV